MPIKLGKGFGRRKSSGTVLEELVNPPEPSFRVLDRSPHSRENSWESPMALKRMSMTRSQSSSLRHGENPSTSSRYAGLLLPSHIYKLIRRSGSGGTHNSASTGVQDDASSSSARFSSSTVPSSTDDLSDEFAQKKSSYHHLRSGSPPHNDSRTFSIKAAGRTFSFGPRRSSFSASRPSEDTQVPLQIMTPPRHRATTPGSLASSASSPRIDKKEFRLATGDFGGGFGEDMFSSLGTSRNTVYEEPEREERETRNFARSVSGARGARLGTSRELTMNTLQESEPALRTLSNHAPPTRSFTALKPATGDSSPESYDSEDESEGLMHPSQSRPSVSALPRPALQEHGLPPPLRPYARDVSPARSYDANDDAPSRFSMVGGSHAQQFQKAGKDGKVHSRSTAPTKSPPRGFSGRFQEPRKASQPHPLSESSSSSVQTPSSSSANSSLRSYPAPQPQNTHVPPGRLHDRNKPAPPSFSSSSNQTTPRAVQKQPDPQEDDEPLFDTGSATAAIIMAQHTPSSSPPPAKSKVMSRGEFEQYKKQKESGKLEDEKSDDSDAYDDEDELEKRKQIARQRRRQEAHLAVYRQQMMKVTGDQPSELPGPMSRPLAPRATYSSPALTPEQRGKQPSKLSDDDDDDEVPLGILQAHGFPHKNRPQMRLANSNSIPDLRSASLPTAGPGSVAGDGHNRNSLPVFAKNLPLDPYNIGAGLVNPAARESLAYGGGSPGSVIGHASQASPQVMPPGGLVGVIAGEERARALRRGSPNANGQYPVGVSPWSPTIPQSPNMGRTPITGTYPGVTSPALHNSMAQGVPPSQGMPSMAPGEHAQVQLSTQMTQFMQMQMQWMQQMMQMQHGTEAGQGFQQMPPAPFQQTAGSPQPQQGGFLGPPGLGIRPTSSMSHNRSASRTMSMANFQQPNHASWPQAQQYAPSVHMNNGGPGPNYTPSIAPSERSNVGQPSRYRPVQTANGASEVPNSIHSRTTTLTDGTVKGFEKAKGSERIGIRPVRDAEDEDDEDGWEQMRRAKEEKRKAWKSRKGSNQGFEVSTLDAAH